MSYQWDFSWVLKSLDVLAAGLLVTLRLTIIAVIGGIVLGLIVALMRQAKSVLLSWTARMYIEIFRDLPVLVVLIWLFYCLPPLLGERLQLSPFWVAALGLGLNFSALQAEIFRAGYEAIPKGQIEAAVALNFKRYQILRYIVVPQALWRSLAPTLGQSINTLKLTALASFISVGELFYVTGRLIQDTFRPLEFYTTLAVLYLLLILPLSLSVGIVERRLAIRFVHE